MIVVFDTVEYKQCVHRSESLIWAGYFEDIAKNANNNQSRGRTIKTRARERKRQRSRDNEQDVCIEVPK